MFYATQQDTISYYARYAAEYVKLAEKHGIYFASRCAAKRGVPAEVLIKAIRGVK